MPLKRISSAGTALRNSLRRGPSHNEELASALLSVLDEQKSYLRNAGVIASALTANDPVRSREAVRHLRSTSDLIDKLKDNMLVNNIRRGLRGMALARKINRLLDAWDSLPTDLEIRNDPQAAGAAYDELFIALGDLECLLPPGLSHYARLVKQIGQSGFFTSNQFNPDNRRISRESGCGDMDFRQQNPRWCR